MRCVADSADAAQRRVGRRVHDAGRGQRRLAPVTRRAPRTAARAAPPAASQLQLQPVRPAVRDARGAHAARGAPRLLV